MDDDTSQISNQMEDVSLGHSDEEEEQMEEEEQQMEEEEQQREEMKEEPMTEHDIDSSTHSERVSSFINLNESNNSSTPDYGMEILYCFIRGLPAWSQY